MYGIDTVLDVLVTLDENSGDVHTVGPLGADIIATGGFDISGISGVAYATLQRANSSQSELWTIDLTTGAATSRGPIGPGVVVRGLLAEVRVPEPVAQLLVGFACLGGLCLRRWGSYHPIQPRQEM